MANWCITRTTENTLSSNLEDMLFDYGVYGVVALHEISNGVYIRITLVTPNDTPPFLIGTDSIESGVCTGSCYCPPLEFENVTDAIGGDVIANESEWFFNVNNAWFLNFVGIGVDTVGTLAVVSVIASNGYDFASSVESNTIRLRVGEPPVDSETFTLEVNVSWDNGNCTSLLSVPFEITWRA